MDKTDLTGLRIWNNAKNGWTVFEVHYTADPAKREQKWADELRPTMSRSTWDREYELKWRTYGGVRVFEDFSRQLHVNQSNDDPISGLPILIGIDFGLTPAAVFCQLVRMKLVILDEMVAFNEPISTFAVGIKDRLNTRFKGFEHQEFVDPSGFFRNQVDGRRCVDELIARGFAPQPGALGWIERKEGIVKLLTQSNKGEPRLKINPRCEWLVAAFDGGYRYDDNISKKDKPIKNEYSHVSDALQYVASQVDAFMPRSVNSNIVIKRPSYGFQRSRR